MSDPDDLALARSILEGLFDPAALCDEELRPSSTNEAFVQLLGMPRRRLAKRLQEGARLLDLLPAEGEDLAARVKEACATRRPVRLAEVRLRARDEELTAWVALVPLVAGDGGCRAVLVVLRDVTAEARMQSHFRQLLAESQARAEELEQKVAERTRELQDVLAEVTRLSRTDPLTGALNRRAFADLAGRHLALAERSGRGLGVLMIDLDHFKQLNDRHGHAAGDAVLVATARALADHVRSTDLVARFGGEEFVILLVDSTPEHVVQIGERICAAIRGLDVARIVPGKQTPQTTSVGVAIWPVHGRTLDELLRWADVALYRAKDQGRDRVVVAE